MSYFLDRLTFFTRVVDRSPDGHSITTREDRHWEDGYRKRWQHDKIVRSTHGVNCTGSCSWKIYVKGGIVTWETQQTDYPRTRARTAEPRAARLFARRQLLPGICIPANRVKYPLVRSRLLKLWRDARVTRTPVGAWASIVEDPDKRAAYVTKRGLGGFVRAHWDEVNEIIAAANAYTIKRHGPDRIIGFSPIPAMSMVSYAAGSRYLSLIGGVCMSFYDWYCDLPPSSPQTWGEQTDVPESADWYNSGFLILWGSNVPQTRTPDAHFYTEARYRGAKSVVICPDYSEASKFADMWMSVKQGTDAALAHGHGPRHPTGILHRHVRPNISAITRASYTDMPILVRLVKSGRSGLVPERLRARLRFRRWRAARPTIPNGRRVAYRSNERRNRRAAWLGRVPLGREGQMESRREGFQGGKARNLRSLSLAARTRSPTSPFRTSATASTIISPAPIIRAFLCARCRSKRVALKDGEALVATVFDLLAANYGVDRGFGGEHVATYFDDNVPYTPAWAEKITGVPRDQIITVAREFARTRRRPTAAPWSSSARR